MLTLTNFSFPGISSVTFDGMTSHVSWKPDLSPTSQINSLFLKMRTVSKNGVLLLIKADKTYLEIDVVGGNLQLTYGNSNTNKREVNVPFFISNGIWHDVLIKTNEDSNTSLIISDQDGSENIHILLDNMVNLTTLIHSPKNKIVMGKIQSDADLYYKGCIREFRLGGVLVPFFLDDQFQNNTTTEKFLLQQKNSLVDGCVGGSGCLYQQCVNEIQCVPDYYSYICECAAGYSGQWCQSNIDNCAGNECGENGVCVDAIDNYTCACKAGYTGDR